MSTDTVDDKQEVVAEEVAKTSPPVTIRLKSSLVAKFAEMAKAKRAPVEKFVEAAVIALLEGLAEGGIVLSAKKLEYLRGKLKKPIATAEGLLDAIDTAQAILPEDNFVYVVDPAYRAPIEQEICIPQGRTFQQVMQDVIDTVMVNHWAYELKFEGGQIPMTAAERDEISSLLGDARPTAQGLIRALQARRK